MPPRKNPIEKPSNSDVPGSDAFDAEAAARKFKEELNEGEDKVSALRRRIKGRKASPTETDTGAEPAFTQYEQELPSPEEIAVRAQEEHEAAEERKKQEEMRESAKKQTEADLKKIDDLRATLKKRKPAEEAAEEKEWEAQLKAAKGRIAEDEKQTFRTEGAIAEGEEFIKKEGAKKLSADAKIDLASWENARAEGNSESEYVTAKNLVERYSERFEELTPALKKKFEVALRSIDAEKGSGLDVLKSAVLDDVAEWETARNAGDMAKAAELGAELVRVYEARAGELPDGYKKPLEKALKKVATDKAAADKAEYKKTLNEGAEAGAAAARKQKAEAAVFKKDYEVEIAAQDAAVELKKQEERIGDEFLKQGEKDSVQAAREQVVERRPIVDAAAEEQRAEALERKGEANMAKEAAKAETLKGMMAEDLDMQAFPERQRESVETAKATLGRLKIELSNAEAELAKAEQQRKASTLRSVGNFFRRLVGNEDKLSTEEIKWHHSIDELHGKIAQAELDAKG